MEPEVRVRLTPQIVLGLVVATLGILFTLDNLGLADAGHYLRYWPIALILIGVTKVWTCRGGAGLVAGALWVVAGGWWVLYNLDLLRVSVWEFWPLLLVLFGAALVWRGLVGPRPTVGASQAGADVSALAVMGGVSRRSNAQDFRGGDLTAVMGGCEVDLRGASMASEAVIDTFALWGGI